MWRDSTVAGAAHPLTAWTLYFFPTWVGGGAGAPCLGGGGGLTIPSTGERLGVTPRWVLRSIASPPPRPLLSPPPSLPPTGKIFAACRDPDSAGALQALWQFNPSRLNIVPADVTCEASLAAVAETIGPRVDLAINTVGVLHDPATAAAAKDGQSAARGGMPETAIARLDPAWFARSVAVNTLGPLLVAKHLAPALAIRASSSASSRRNGPPGRRPSVLATLSARVGSISDNRIGGWYSYRVSKAGQNQATRTLAIELGRKGIVVVGLHPGTVETDLSAPFRRNVPDGKLFAVDDAAVRLLDVIDSLDAEADAGTLLAYDGTTIPF